jgi:hypothetical protein
MPVVVPLPVAAPLGAVPPVAPPVAPPLCAKADTLVNASTVARANVASLIAVSLSSSDEGQTAAEAIVPDLAQTLMQRYQAAEVPYTEPEAACKSTIRLTFLGKLQRNFGAVK